MKDGSLRLAFVGDVALGFLKHLPDPPAAFPGWRAIMEVVAPQDMLVGNLECCLVDERCDEQVRAEPMAVPSSFAPLLREAGFSALCLANNHMLDCGAEAIEVTRERLAALNIRHFGAGSDISEAEATTFVERRGYRIALLAACDSARYYATGDKAGVAPLEKARLGARVREAAGRADLVVVSLHADLEFTSAPARWRQRLSRWLVEQGAHLVIQHHPHVLQGIESYNSGLIAYSLGNFVFPLRGNHYQEIWPGVFDSAVLMVDVNFSAGVPRLSYRIVPLRIADDHFPRRLSNSDRQAALRRIEELSCLVRDKRTVRRVWFRRCRSESRRRLMAVYYALRRGQLGHGIRQALRLIGGREERRWMLGLFSFGYM